MAEFCHVRFKLTIFLLLSLFSAVSCRIHKLKIQDDVRKQIQLTTFGFVRGGFLYVEITDFDSNQLQRILSPDSPIGFTLDKSLNNGKSPFLDNGECGIVKPKVEDGKNIIVFRVVPENRTLTIERGSTFQNTTITLDVPREVERTNATDHRRRRRSVNSLWSISSDSRLLSRHKRAAESTVDTARTTSLPLTTDVKELIGDGRPLSSIPFKLTNNEYSVHFMLKVTTAQEEGLYNLVFHNCYSGKLNFTVTMVESNVGSYLSAGQRPLPTLYLVCSVVYLLVGTFWLWILCTSKEGVFKIHYLMLAMMYIKSISLLFHGVNYHFIKIEGHQEEAFAILFYIIYLLKGIFMFVTIVLIGAGWTFVKHILSDRDKKIFVIVIPLQILANVASIIIEESEEGQTSYTLWKNILIIVDLLCCGAILFPVVWSIRHLQQASETDGKAAINLEKLKIFRHFYILVVCFIYFTRIIVLLLSITVPFQYEWIDDLFIEIATLGFFMMTGYKFRPASNNPYLQVSQSDDETELDEVLTRTGLLDGVTKVNVKTKNDDGSESTMKQRESSHEYD